MSINSPPLRGYDDWQRTVNYDSGALYNNAAISTPPIVTVLGLNMSRYACVGGEISCATGAMNVALLWSVDSLQTEPVATRNFVLIPNNNLIAQINIPNLGPFLRARFISITGGVSTGSALLIGTNRELPYQMIPNDVVLIPDTTTNVPANGSVAVYPNDYYAGPVRLDVNPAAAGAYQIQYLNTANVWTNMFIYTPAVGAETVIQSQTPMGAWRVLIQNLTAGAANFILNMAYSPTGAS